MTENELFTRFIESLNDVRSCSSEDGQNPLMVEAEVDGFNHTLAVYIYTCGNPPGGRTINEFKINIAVKGQKTGTRSNFEFDKGFVLLVGYIREYNVFVLWDAYKHLDFAYKSNAQVKIETIKNAIIYGLSTQNRRLNIGTEVVICCSGHHLDDAIAKRFDIYVKEMGSVKKSMVQQPLFRRPHLF